MPVIIAFFGGIVILAYGHSVKTPGAADLSCVMAGLIAIVAILQMTMHPRKDNRVDRKQIKEAIEDLLRGRDRMPHN